MSEKNQSATHNTRTCSACGLRKPLLAFLELAGAGGHRYGDICSACRGKGIGIKKDKIDVADSGGGSTRVQLDNKVKIQREQDRQDQLKLKTELDSGEKAKKDNLSDEKSSDSADREKAEKQLREDHSQSKGHDRKAESPKDKKAVGLQSFYLDKSRGEKSFFQNLAQGNTTADASRQFGQDETQKTATGDVSVVATDKQDATVGRSDESVFGRFREYLGNSGVMNRTLEKYSQKTESTEPKRPFTSFLSENQKNANSEKAANEKANTEKNLATEFINNNLKRR